MSAKIDGASNEVRLTRVYDIPGDGGRPGMFLVDRVWPRGITKDELRMVPWLRALGPSSELRQWFGHQVERWPEFRRRYRAELMQPESKALLNVIRGELREHPVTLLYGARDTQHNQAVVLREVLLEENQAKTTKGVTA